MAWAEGASGVEGAGWPSSPTSMASSLLEEASDSSSSEGEGASGCGGGIGLALHSLEKASWSSPQLGQLGSGAAARDGLGVAALVAGGVLASVSRASMMKHTVGAGGVFLSVAGRGVSEPVAVGALGAAINLRRFLDFEPL